MDGPMRSSLSPMGPPRPWYPASFTPLKLASLQQWFDADLQAGTDGQPLPQLTDLSGKGKHGTQATGSKQALWIANALNGHAAIRLDGVDDFYDLTGLSIGSSTNKTLIICASIPASANNQRYLFDSAGGRLALYASDDVNHNDGVLDGTTRRNCTAHQAGAHILTFQIMPAVSAEVRRDSTVVSMPTVGLRAISGATALGANSGGTSLFTDMDLYGWIVCNTYLSTIDRSSAEVYYKLKYGIT
jgi:hypothetical protein